jgi:NAD-dependent dihydropyrimidine dehydrogenase PreA subunit/flavodoxin
MVGNNMIFYFTGTGNSLQAAKSIAEHNGETLISIASEMNSKDSTFEYTLKDNEVIGFVYPVYSWGPPEMVLDFIKRLKLNNYKDNYTFSVATCGDNIGNTMKVLKAELNKKKLDLHSGFSLQMPNTYIVMFNVDSMEIQNKKLSAAEETLKGIIKIIEERKRGVFQIKKGPVPFILTSVINPGFNKGARDTKKFYANDNCTGCGICEKVCNTQTIKVEGKPKWGKECTQCLACIHLCPVKAIQFGKGTEKKGRYKNPNVKVSEMMK